MIKYKNIKDKEDEITKKDNEELDNLNEKDKFIQNIDVISKKEDKDNVPTEEENKPTDKDNISKIGEGEKKDNKNKYKEFPGDNKEKEIYLNQYFILIIN